MIGIFLPPSAVDVSKIRYAVKLISIFDREKYKNKILVLAYKNDIELLKEHVRYIPIRSFDFSKFRRKKLNINSRFRMNSDSEYDVAIDKYDLKFGIFPTPPVEIVNCSIPYAAAIQSMGHRLNPELEETTQNGIWKTREDIYSSICKKADLIFIDSEMGKEYLKFYYDPIAEIAVIPHSLPDGLSVEVDTETQKKVKKKFGIFKDFLFYPAQFWPHKNHVRILEAVRCLKNRKIDIQLVFNGSNKSIREKYNIEYRLRRIAKDSNMEGSLIITGYLEDYELKTLYINALAMVMPQLIPEPCIPYVEAMGLGCPVVASNIPGIRELVNEAAALVDPYSIESIADGIELLLDQSTRDVYIKKGFDNYHSLKISTRSSFSSVENKIMSYC